jgi:hypothetical protein
MFDFGEGVDYVPEEWFLKDQAWHTNPITEKQVTLLRKLGVKAKSMPESAGEASELIDVLQMEKDIRSSQVATAKQKWFIRQNNLTMPGGTSMDTITRSQAARLIVQFKIQNAKGPSA